MNDPYKPPNATTPSNALRTRLPPGKLAIPLCIGYVLVTAVPIACVYALWAESGELRLEGFSGHAEFQYCLRILEVPVIVLATALQILGAWWSIRALRFGGIRYQVAAIPLLVLSFVALLFGVNMLADYFFY